MNRPSLESPGTTVRSERGRVDTGRPERVSVVPVYDRIQIITVFSSANNTFAIGQESVPANRDRGGCRSFASTTVVDRDDRPRSADSFSPGSSGEPHGEPDPTDSKSPDVEGPIRVGVGPHVGPVTTVVDPIPRSFTPTRTRGASLLPPWVGVPYPVAVRLRGRPTRNVYTCCPACVVLGDAPRLGRRPTRNPRRGASDPVRIDGPRSTDEERRVVLDLSKGVPHGRCIICYYIQHLRCIVPGACIRHERQHGSRGSWPIGVRKHRIRSAPVTDSLGPVLPSVPGRGPGEDGSRSVTALFPAADERRRSPPWVFGSVPCEVARRRGVGRGVDAAESDRVSYSGMRCITIRQPNSCLGVPGVNTADESPRVARPPVGRAVRRLACPSSGDRLDRARIRAPERRVGGSAHGVRQRCPVVAGHSVGGTGHRPVGAGRRCPRLRAVVGSHTTVRTHGNVFRWTTC